MSQNINVPFHLPHIDESEERNVLSVLRSGWLTTGKKTLELEQRFCELYEVKHALAVNSATAGLFLSLRALGIGQGDVVLLPSYTFVATANVVEHLGAEIHFVDCDEDSCISLEDTRRSLVQLREQKKTPRAIIVVHMAGRSVDVKDFEQFGLPVIEDAAHSFPMRTKVEGVRGKAVVFSFYATKTLSAAEGGIVLTDDDELAKQISALRLHGIDRQVWDRYQKSGEKSWQYDIVDAGYKMNFPDILAALALAQFEKKDLLLQQRSSIAQRYLAGLKNIDALILPRFHPHHSWHLFCIQLDFPHMTDEQLDDKRNLFLAELKQRDIGFSVHFIPVHTFSYYQQKYQLQASDLPFTYRRYCGSVSLPIYPGMSDEQIEYVIASIQEIVENG